GDHHLQSARARTRRPLHDATRVAMRRAHLHLVRQTQVLEHFDAGLHERQVRLRAEDDADDWLQLNRLLSNVRPEESSFESYLPSTGQRGLAGLRDAVTQPDRGYDPAAVGHQPGPRLESRARVE